MAPIRRKGPKRSRCGWRAFPVRQQAAIHGQAEYNQWPADGQRRSDAWKLQQRLADSRLRRINRMRKGKG